LRDRPFLSDRFFFVTVRLLKRRRPLDDADFQPPALAIRRARAIHPFFLTAWVFLPDPAAAGQAIFAPQDPLTISEVMKSIKNSSTTLTNRGRAAWGELWQGGFLIVPCCWSAKRSRARFFAPLRCALQKLDALLVSIEQLGPSLPDPSSPRN
jgi:hypothetical protein